MSPCFWMKSAAALSEVRAGTVHPSSMWKPKVPRKATTRSCSRSLAGRTLSTLFIAPPLPDLTSYAQGGWIIPTKLGGRRLAHEQVLQALLFRGDRHDPGPAVEGQAEHLGHLVVPF